ncbi:predicted protein [Aspergillus terreus NIH2624]|uniref:Uncharacterized protein n=1 Tax=Aspergillus terreus (strain NIH 2624 / FGSC A1156) TaxID=341663 RepID=Q0CPF7_ASPTN|nr:uncharacterized protein ATEG_04427 [Aspergillus terreus NIH2624]EAU34874.1 predicted protein [Aspergillus terreus NIH2624]
MYVIVNIKKWNKAKESSRGCYIGLIIDYFVRSKYRHIDFILFLSVLHPSSGRPPKGRYSTLTHLGWTTLKGDTRWTFRLLHRVRGILGTFASATDLCLVLVDWLGRVLLPASQVGTLRTAHNLLEPEHNPLQSPLRNDYSRGRRGRPHGRATGGQSASSNEAQEGGSCVAAGAAAPGAVPSDSIPHSGPTQAACPEGPGHHEGMGLEGENNVAGPQWENDHLPSAQATHLTIVSSTAFLHFQTVPHVSHIQREAAET